MNLPRSSRVGGPVVVVIAVVLAVLACYLVLLNQAVAQRAAQEQYGADGQGTPAPERGGGPADRVTLCHATSSETNPYVTITVDRNSIRYQGHLGHPDDIIPAPAGGCPSGPTPEPTTPEPTTPPEPTTSSPTATPAPTTPEPTPEPTTGTPTATASATTEPTDDGGCPVPEPTTASPTASPSATATATDQPTPTPEPTTTEPTSTATPATETATSTATASPTPEPTDGGTTPEPTDGSPSASASVPVTVVPTTPAAPTPTASATDEPDPNQPFTPTPTAVATNPGENPDGPFEVTDPDGGVSTLSFYDLDVHDDPPLPGGPGGITRSEMRGQRAAAQSLVEGGDFHEAVAAAQPFLNACDSRDAVRLAAVQLGIPLPETGGPAALGLIAIVLLIGSGLFAWQLGVRGRL